MLVLTRRVADQILVPSLGITLEVLSIRGNVVKLGITAPQDVRVLRGELMVDSAKSRQPKSVESQSRLNVSPPAAEKPHKGPVRSGDCAAQTSPLGSYLGKKGETSASRRKHQPAHTKPVLSLADDAPESVCESRTAYEVCI